ncbi:MAG: hypothetical protein GY774_38775 [Planctomycetes bacterium]|nr:hypothetical protein [Planctomycetota bacterium]
MKRTLERELKVPEIAGREVNGISAICEIAVEGFGWHVLFFLGLRATLVFVYGGSYIPTQQK